MYIRKFSTIYVVELNTMHCGGVQMKTFNFLCTCIQLLCCAYLFVVVVFSVLLYAAFEKLKDR